MLMAAGLAGPGSLGRGVVSGRSGRIGMQSLNVMHELDVRTDERPARWDARVGLLFLFQCLAVALANSCRDTLRDLPDQLVRGPGFEGLVRRRFCWTGPSRGEFCLVR